MFIFEFSADAIMDAVTNWIYQKIIGLFGELFEKMNSMGVDLFSLPWVNQIVRLFGNIGWALFAVGIVVAFFEFAIESQNGRGDVKALALNIIKGFMAVNLFTVVPVKLYGFAVSLQSSMNGDMTGLIYVEDKSLSQEILDSITCVITDPLLAIFLTIMTGYAIVKVFLASLKRGGILLIQIAVGSMYMFSVPRGFSDGFIMWIKQVIAACLTTFLQSAMLVCGLILFKEHWLLGLGVMLSAGEIPRIAGMFGLETSVRPNITGAINTAQAAVKLTQSVKTIVTK